jgi:hypothetical protein
MVHALHEIDLVLTVSRCREGLLSVCVHSRVVDQHPHQVLMSVEQMLVLGISILRAVSLEEEFGKRTTLGGLRVGRNVYWLRRHSCCIY